jgi:hypothetical protein
MHDLSHIGKKFPTSKNISGFLDIYENHFKKLRDLDINILEIGVDRGDSLRLWREYFSKAKICGIDIIKKDFKIDNVEILTGDQSDQKFLNTIISKYNNFDIIIDDGSHISSHIIKSFSYLFKYLSKNGLYIIEDLQTSYIPRYGGSRINLNKRRTSMNFIKTLCDSVNYEHNDKPFFKKKKYDGLIKEVHFYQNISFIQKGETINYYYKNEFKKKILDKIKRLISTIYK